MELTKEWRARLHNLKRTEVRRNRRWSAVIDRGHNVGDMCDGEGADVVDMLQVLTVDEFLSLHERELRRCHGGGVKGAAKRRTAQVQMIRKAYRAGLCTREDVEEWSKQLEESECHLRGQLN